MKSTNAYTDLCFQVKIVIVSENIQFKIVKYFPLNLHNTKVVEFD